MSVAPVEFTPPTSEPVAAAPTPPAEAPKPTEPPKAAEVPPTTTGGLPDDPAELHNMIRDLRKENASRRTKYDTAAEDAKKELAQTIGKALGLVEDEPVDPAKLTESLTVAQTEAKQARVELAVFRNAATAGGDPAALLDSSSFLASLAAVDPTDSAAVTAAIQSAITANPRLGAAPAAPRTPAPNPAQGSSATGAPATGQLTEADVKRLSDEGKHGEIVKAREEGRLRDYLGS